MAAEKAHVFHQGVLARHPHSAGCAAIDSAGVESDANHDIGATRRGFQ